mgnify:CR=1 FL=1
MNDYIIRAIAANDQIRAFAAPAIHDPNTSPVATAALGRLLTAGAMMGTMMKGDKDILTLQIKAGGPLEGITVTADSKGRVKGYVGNPDVCIPANSKGKLDVAGAVGVGFMNVIKDMGLARLRFRPVRSQKTLPIILLQVNRYHQQLVLEFL